MKAGLHIGSQIISASASDGRAGEAEGAVQELPALPGQLGQNRDGTRALSLSRSCIGASQHVWRLLCLAEESDHSPLMLPPLPACRACHRCWGSGSSKKQVPLLALALLFVPFALHMALALFAVHALTTCPRAPQVIILCAFRLRRSAIRHFDRTICVCLCTFVICFVWVQSLESQNGP